jgi:hypothetical protein
MLEYVIGGKKYTQQKLVLGQVQQLLTLVKGKNIPADFSPFKVIESLGDDLCEGIAIILREHGQPLKDKDPKVLAKEIQFAIDPETAFRVVEDFFACNPIAPMFQGLAGQINRIAENMLTGLSRPSSPSAEETSQEETKSSGDSV